MSDIRRFIKVQVEMALIGLTSRYVCPNVASLLT